MIQTVALPRGSELERKGSFASAGANERTAVEEAIEAAQTKALEDAVSGGQHDLHADISALREKVLW